MSTVFYDGQNSPGSPRSIAGNSVMRWPNWPVIRAVATDRQSLHEAAHRALYVDPPTLPPPSRPIEQLVARDRSTGVWQIAVNDGRRFKPTNLNYWAPGRWTAIVSGDFNGDGLTDLLGRYIDGTWWLGRANGNAIEFKQCEIALGDSKFDYAGVGDFNGDGIDDLLVRSAVDGGWWIALSDGTRFHVRRWGQSAAGVPPENIRIADFNGNGRSDVAGFNPKTGEWTVSLSDGKRLVTSRWGGWDPQVAWRHLLAADFTDDKRCDVAAWNPATGTWQLGRSNGRKFEPQSAGAWPANADWQFVQTGRFGNSARRGIVGLDKKSKRLAISDFDGRRFTTRLVPSHPALENGIYVGNFTGDDRDSLAGLTNNHEIWLGILDHDAIHFEQRGIWPGAERLVDFRVLSFWR